MMVSQENNYSVSLSDGTVTTWAPQREGGVGTTFLKAGSEGLDVTWCGESSSDGGQGRTGSSNRPWLNRQTGLIRSGVTRNSGTRRQPNRVLPP